MQLLRNVCQGTGVNATGVRARHRRMIGVIGDAQLICFFAYTACWRAVEQQTAANDCQSRSVCFLLNLRDFLEPDYR